MGLENLRPDLQVRDTDATERDKDGVNVADHVWHELSLPEDISETEEAPTFAELVDQFRAVSWNDRAPVPTLG